MREGVVLRITPRVLTAEQELLLHDFFFESTGRILTGEVFELIGFNRDSQADGYAIGVAMANLGWQPIRVRVGSAYDDTSYAYIRGTTIEERKRWLTIVNGKHGQPKLVKRHPIKTRAWLPDQEPTA